MYVTTRTIPVECPWAQIWRGGDRVSPLNVGSRFLDSDDENFHNFRGTSGSQPQTRGQHTARKTLSFGLAYGSRGTR